MIGFDGVMRRRNETQEEDEVGSNTIPRSAPVDIPRRHAGAPVAVAAPMPNVTFNINMEVQTMIQFFETMDNSHFSIEKKEAISIIVDRVKNEVHGQQPAPIPHGLFENSNSNILMIIQFITRTITISTQSFNIFSITSISIT